MSTKSNTSSLEPQNGSAYSLSLADLPYQRSPASVTYSANPARYPAGIPQNQPAAMTQHSVYGSWANTNGYQCHNGHTDEFSDEYSHTSEAHATSASTHHTLSPPEHQPGFSMDGQMYQQYGRYYLPVTSFPPQEQLNYDSVLVIDSIEDEQAQTLADPSRSSLAGYGEARTRDQEPPTAARYAEQTSHAANVTRTPTTRRWSREYSPEERMRLGLPRWESEQHRIDYERRQQGRQRSRHGGRRS